MAEPVVSVVMAVRNGGDYLPAAVESILQQTFAEFEFLIFDDGSTDSTGEYLDSLRDPRVKITRNAAGLGHAPNLNRGIKVARGRYIARQDADDISLPGRLAAQVAYMDSHPLCALLGTAYGVIGPGGELVEAQYEPCMEELALRWQMLFRNPFAHTSVMVRADALAAVGPYAEYLFTAEDFDLWSRIARCFEVAMLPEVLVYWRRHPASLTSTQAPLQHREKDRTVSANFRELMGRELDETAYAHLRQLFASPAAFRPDLSAAQILSAITFLLAMQSAFYVKNRQLRNQVGEHRRHWARVWAKHLFALAVRARGGVAERAAYVLQGLRMLSRTVSRPW